MNENKKPSLWPKVTRIIANVIIAVFTVFALALFLPVGLLGAAALVVYNIGESKARKERKECQQQNAFLQEQVAALSKFQSVVDADAEAAKIRETAQAEAAKMKAASETEATALKAAAETEVQALKLAAEAEAAALKAEALDNVQSARAKLASAETAVSRRMADADTEAKRIIAAAETKAEEIAGDAYQIKKSVDELKRTETALRNAIEGYGNEWLKPTYSLLDELGDEFSHTDAGAKLKDARRRSAVMVSSGIAAVCDYVENNRRKTAINFVVDAFNGKVDSILSKTKRDNYGKLEQQIRDAYQMVNMNGQAFRNARITPEYLDARLQELKWAVAVMELRMKEQEEQRRIREQMREEAKARREFERAQKAAAKEEELLRKAMEKAQSMLEKASEEQRAKYEAQLADYAEKLKAAKEKSQRALSMAQQTRRGNVYVISNVGSFGENVYKVGMTRRLEPLERVRELGDASVPFAFDVHAIIESEDAPALEHMLHQELAMMQVNKVNPRKEFFRVSLSDIRALVETHGLSVNWTMTAEAAEYHETLAIEERMKNDPDAQKRWAAFYERISEVEEDDEEAEYSLEVAAAGAI